MPAGAPVVVVGAGVAGCAVAGALRRAGYGVTLLDRAGRLGAEASGNPCGLLKPRLTADGGHHGRLYGQGYQYAVATLDRLAATEAGRGIWLGRGLLSVARDAGERDTMVRLASTLPVDHIAVVDGGQARALAGVEAPLGGLWFPRAGAISPSAVCAALAEGVAVSQGAVARLEPTDGGWQVCDDAGAVIALGAAVVLAGGPWTPRLWPAAELPIHANRGQITLMAALRPAPPASLSFGGYLSPPFMLDGALRQVLGATYDRIADPDPEADAPWRAEQAADHAANLDLLHAHLPAVAAGWAGTGVAGGRVALRATIADHLPVAGPLFSAGEWRAAYADLHHGRGWDRYPPAPLADGLFVLGGLGSRGFQVGPLLAEALVAEMAGRPLPLDRDLWEAVHPGRFVLRTLRRPPPRGSGGRTIRSSGSA